jgi:MFS family permease
MTTQAIPVTREQTLPAPTSRIAERLRGPAELVRMPGFLQLVIGNALSHAFAMRMQGIAIAWVVLEMTGSRMWLGIINGVPAISIIVFSLLAGVLADTRDSRRVLLVVRSGLVATAFTGSLLILTGQIRLEYLIIYALVVVGLSAIDLPLARTLTMQMVGPARLMNANATQTMIMNVISIITPMSIALVIGLGGTWAAFSLLGIGYTFGTLFLWKTRLEAPAMERHGSKPLADLVAGLSYVKATPTVAGLVSLGFLMPFVGVYFALIPVFARDVLSSGAGGLGILVGAFSLGSLIGSIRLVTRGTMTKRGCKVALLSVIFGAGMIAFALSESMLISSLISVGMGFVGAYWQNMLTTMVQTESAPEMRGRALSVFTMGFQLASLGWLIGGATASFIGPQAAVIAAGAIFAGLSTLIMATRPEVCQID